MDSQAQELRKIVAGLLGDRRLLNACAQRDMGGLFRLINARGVSTRRIASAVGISQGRLHDYMTGKSAVEKLALFEQISDGLGIPGRLLGLARRQWEPSVEQVPQQQAVAPEGSDVAAMEAFRRADRQSGGSRLYGAVVRHLTDRVGPRLVGSGGAQVFAAAAALTEMAGWMAHDAARDQVAAQHFANALPLAQAAGDTALAAHIAASRSHLTLEQGDPVAAAHWAETGLELAGHAPRIPHLIARLHAMRARALAAARQHAPARQALDQAQRMMERPAAAEHPWLSRFDDAAFTSEAALVELHLNQLDRALDTARQAVALREDGRARSLALSRITLADVHVRRGELDEAVATGDALLGGNPALSSVRVLHQLEVLRQGLEAHREYRPVREHLVRLAESRRSRMLLMADVLTPSGGTE